MGVQRALGLGVISPRQGFTQRRSIIFTVLLISISHWRAWFQGERGQGQTRQRQEAERERNGAYQKESEMAQGWSGEKNTFSAFLLAALSNSSIFYRWYLPSHTCWELCQNDYLVPVIPGETLEKTSSIYLKAITFDIITTMVKSSSANVWHSGVLSIGID